MSEFHRKSIFTSGYSSNHRNTRLQSVVAAYERAVCRLWTVFIEWWQSCYQISNVKMYHDGNVMISPKVHFHKCSQEQPLQYAIAVSCGSIWTSCIQLLPFPLLSFPFIFIFRRYRVRKCQHWMPFRSSRRSLAACASETGIRFSRSTSCLKAQMWPRIHQQDGESLPNTLKCAVFVIRIFGVTCWDHLVMTWNSYYSL